MNFTKQLYASVLITMLCGGLAAKSNGIQYGPSFESSLLPGSHLVAGGKDEFFITGKAEQATMPVIAKVSDQSFQPTIKKVAIEARVQLAQAIKPVQPKPIVMTTAIKPTSVSMDASEKRINQLFALHHSIVTASQAKHAGNLARYASLEYERRHQTG